MKTNSICVCVLIFVNSIKILLNRVVPCYIYKSRVLIHMKANCKSVCVCANFVKQIYLIEKSPVV